MAEEFQESEVIFSDDSDDSCFDFRDMTTTHVKSLAKKRSKAKKKKMANSLPVNVPANHHHHRMIFGARFGDNKDTDQYHLEEDEEEWEEGELVPPHLIVGRRIAGKAEFSVCTGNGRTLKGRDLSQVRNSILRMTGFLET